MKTIITDPEAQAELEEAADWYEQRRAGLGAAFLESIADAVADVQRSPKAALRFKDTNIRKKVVQRFPYVIFFEEFHAQILIYAFAHTKRRPGYWLKRLKDEEKEVE